MLKRKYKKPAIQEAIFEAKFEQYNFDNTVWGQIYDLVKTTYPDKRDIKQVSIRPLPIEIPLLRAIKSDKSELIQFGPGIATANKLKYISWDDFVIAINTVLKSYFSIAKPRLSTRVATRYINSFYIPESLINVRDYFNIGLQIPENISDIEAFNVTLLNKFKDGNLEFQVNTKFFSDSLKEGEVGNRFILDIDCFSVANKFSPKIDELILIASKAHDYLETVFESLITNKSRELMEVLNEQS